MRLSFFALALALVVSGCSKDNPTSPSANVPFSTVDVRVGTGAEATTGRQVQVNYSGYLYSATAAENKGTPWEVFAKRARVESLGLEWKAYMPSKDTDDDKMDMKK